MPTPDHDSELAVYRARQLVYTASNGLSLMRLLMAVPMVVVLWHGQRQMAVALGIAAAVTDMLDGHIARRFRQESELGKILDPLADKVFVAATVVTLVLRGELALWLAATVLARDVAILIAGMIVKSRTGLVLPSNITGKIAVIVLSILLLLLVLNVQGIAVTILIALVLGLLAFSTFSYARRAAEVLRKGNKG